MFSAMVLIRLLNGLYHYFARIAREQWDGVMFHLITFLIPMRTLKTVVNLLLGLGISVWLIHYFTIQGASLRLPRVMFLSLFILIVAFLYGSYRRVRAAFLMILVGMMSHVGIFLLLCSTIQMLVNATHGVTVNFMELSRTAQCVSNLHAEMYRDSLLAYINPVTKNDSDYEEVLLVKERDMAQAQESMKLKADITLTDAMGDKMGEQRVSER